MVVDTPEDPLTNLRFADDFVLVAVNKSGVSKMLADLKKEAAKYGLVAHMGKTKILTSASLNLPACINIEGADVDIVPPATYEKYLGRHLYMGSYHESELSNRMNGAWRCFAKFKDVLCSRSYPLRSRLQLFDAVVTPTAMYGCECWTLNVHSRRMLRTTWRKMVRNIFRTPRGDEETWVDYVRRATAHAEARCADWGFRNWAITQPKRKENFAARVANDNADKWNYRLLHWRPWHRCSASRRPGRPRLRWRDAVKHVFDM